jgi:sporulation protein YlmC with PRC-barrel domain
MMSSENMAEKKLRGSGGYVIARVTDEEQKKGNLGGPELFLAGVGRLDDDRFVKYYCNRCEKEYPGQPDIVYDNPNEDLGEGVILLEKGEYRCKTCNYTLAQYRKFDTPETQTGMQANSDKSEPEERPAMQTQNIEMLSAAGIPSAPIEQAKTDSFLPIESLVGMSAYDSDAMLIGMVQKVGLRRLPGGKVQISIKLEGKEEGDSKEVIWENISKIGDIVLVGSKAQEGTTSAKSAGLCPSCRYQNEPDAVFCGECGTKLA